MQTIPNDTKPWMTSLRFVIVLAALGLVAAVTGTVVVDLAVRTTAGAPARADELLVGCAAALALLLSAWLSLGVVVVALAAVPGTVGRWAGTVADAVTPRATRRLVGLVLGVTVAAGVAPGASVAAAPTSTTAAHLDRPDPSFAPLPDPGWVPEPPTVRPHPDLSVLSRAPRVTTVDDEREVVVRRGDSLWSIAARHLGPHPSDAEVARAWPAWFAANRDVVGDDPDVLRPGQLLRVPEGVLS